MASRTFTEIEMRVEALAFAGRSYAGLSPEIAERDAERAEEQFRANAAEDIMFLLKRDRELRSAIFVAEAYLIDAADTIVERYARDEDEAHKIRQMIGDPVEQLGTIARDIHGLFEETK